jgi:hypothetical protein
MQRKSAKSANLNCRSALLLIRDSELSIPVARRMLEAPAKVMIRSFSAMRRSGLLTPSVLRKQFGGNCGSLRHKQVHAQSQCPSELHRWLRVVRRMAVHHWLPATGILERCSGPRYLALLHRRPLRHVTALIARLAGSLTSYRPRSPSTSALHSASRVGRRYLRPARAYQ